jgi:hypothetical protein
VRLSQVGDLNRRVGLEQCYSVPDQGVLRTFFLGRCVPWMICPLDDVSPYEPSLTGGRGGGMLTVCRDRFGKDRRVGILD